MSRIDLTLVVLTRPTSSTSMGSINIDVIIQPRCRWPPRGRILLLFVAAEVTAASRVSVSCRGRGPATRTNKTFLLNYSVESSSFLAMGDEFLPGC